MWKITKLHLKNFICVYSGMKRHEVTLDFTNCDKKINIFIGKMGSGKTTILGHLQPFADYGTLDVKNRLDGIIEGEDGLKEISFLHDGHVYDIKHVFTWNKSSQSHSTKSFISLDGKELNSNGNVSSFKELIRIHFGIDQSFLRLLRLGPNVANVINMKSTERKAFIATLLKDTEIYMMLSKKLGEDLRTLNSTISVLNNKLIGLSSNKENEMKAEAEDLEEEILDLSKRMDQVRESIAKLKGINMVLSKGTRGDILGALDKNETLLIDKENRYSDVVEALDTLPTEGIEKLSMQYADILSNYNNTEEEIMRLQMLLEPNEIERNKLTDEILLIDNTDQIAELEKQQRAINIKFSKADSRLIGFTPRYDYTFLINFMTTLDSFQLSLEEMCNNPEEVIHKCYFSDNSIKAWARKKINMITGRRVNLKKALENIQFSAEYECPIPLWRPPACPTEECPFIVSHPAVIGEKNKTLQSIKDLKDKIDLMDRELAILADYGTQYPKMGFLKDNWKIVSGVLRNLDLLYDNNLYNLLMDLGLRNRWYNRDGLLEYMELAKLFEDYDGMRKRNDEINRELAKLKESDVDSKKEQLAKLQEEYDNSVKKIEELLTKKETIVAERDRLGKILANVGNREALQVEKTKLESEIENLKTSIFELKTRANQYEDNNREIHVLDAQMGIISSEYDQKTRKYNDLRNKLQDIRSTTNSYEEYVEEARILRLILGAVSSKEGIPLVMVKVFLDECKEIINDLISDIFEDNLEIVEFNISEESNEFKIPYSINGNIVSDIEFASQGQQAVISIALSFALCRKAMFDYNIMLLDEIDNSIHKTDRERFIMILSKQMMALGTEQAFLITHNDIFQQSGLPVNIIMTTPEVIDHYDNQTIMQIY